MASQHGRFEGLVHRPRRPDHRHGQAVSKRRLCWRLLSRLAGTVREAMGYGRQKDRLHQYRKRVQSSSFVSRSSCPCWCGKKTPAAVKAIVGQARTGRIGDGKVLVLPCYEEYLSW